MAKRPHQEEKGLELDGFQFGKVLMNDPKSKRVHILGKFKGSDDDAIITMVKTPFSEDSVRKLLTIDTTLELEFSNDIYGKYDALPKPCNNTISTNIIKPATQKHINKYTQQLPYLLYETAHDYQQITKPYLEERNFSIEWVYNILEHKKESERIVFEDPNPETGFVLLPDLKWDAKQVEDLYLIAIVHTRGLRSIRELNATHLPLLKNILTKGLASIRSKYNVESAQIRAYLHYYPSYYHLHVHFNHLQYDVGGHQVGKAHLLQDVIDNIENVAGDFYAKKTLPVTLFENDPLLKLLTTDKDADVQADQ